jgi:FMN-dependent NADH-azoreductase
MKDVLLVLSSPRGDESYSQRIAKQFVDEIRARHPDADVVVRDLAKNPLPHVAEPFVSGRLLPAEQRNTAQAEALVLSDVVDEIEGADVVVLAVPMHNFGVPSSLKAWIDHIVRPGRTFSYSKRGPKGLVEGKKAIIVVARGGVYSQGPMMSFEFQESYLRSVLAFIGIVDVDFVRVEGVAMGEDAVRTALAHAQTRVRDLVRDLAPDRARDAMRAAA